ncbi:MAG: hypothetical protein ACOC4E_03240 [Patescibacteria group bacterium]
MKSAPIAIIGHGYVGQALERYFQDTFDIVIYDPAQGYTDQAAANQAGLAVVCVPTPMAADGAVDLRCVEDTFRWLQTPAIVLKSTVPPGTTEALAAQYDLQDRLVFSPEFIGEGGYPIPHWEDMPHPTDMKQHRHLIFGGTAEARAAVIPYFERVSGPFAHYHTTDATTAELTKYMENTWIATKVTFCNEFYDIAAAYDVDWHELRELWLTDGRVGRSHTVVYPHKRGFDGKCIPKDTNGLVAHAAAHGYEASFLRAVLKRNEELRSRSH